jgi:ABC-type bacteriocin/lantibiotic exporter with double-glycine peptidase domain
MRRRGAAKAIVCLLCCCGVVLAADPAGAWLDVPFIKQEKDGCGAASIAMVMQYWQKQQGSATSESAEAAHILRKLYSAPANGIYASDLESYLKQNGFQTFSFAGSWGDLKQHVEKGRPLIVATKPAGAAPLHYMVVTGVDWKRQLVLVNDPAGRKLLKMDRPTFEKQWSAAGSWTLLAVPQHRDN